MLRELYASGSRVLADTHVELGDLAGSKMVICFLCMVRSEDVAPGVLAPGEEF
jgi:hypothetical protein